MNPSKYAFSRRSAKLFVTFIMVGLATSLLLLLSFVVSVSESIAVGPETLYVNNTDGVDSLDCGTTTVPCMTISHTLAIRASAGDTILVAEGIYTENLVIDKTIILKGGYSANDWTRGVQTHKSVIDGSADANITGDWDGATVGTPTVLSDSTELKMWYDGADLNGDNQIGYASSTNNISWTKSTSNPVLSGDTGSWDEYGEHAAFVMKEAGQYKMWYEGSNGHVRQLGYATSPDGLTWSKHPGNPVMTAGPQAYDMQGAGHGYVMRDGSVYRLWYHAIGDLGPIIAYATSTDGLNWTKQGPALVPIGGSWDEYALWGPSVLKLDGTYWMWYSGAGPLPPAMGVATSTNGITWTRNLTGPVLQEADKAIGHGHVVTESGSLKMWYQDLENGAIRLAESLDGISWTVNENNPVLEPGQLVQKWGKPVVSVNANNVVIDGFTITGGRARDVGGIEAGTNTIIRNCEIQYNFADGSPNSTGGAGVQAFAGDTVTIVDTKIVGNKVNQGASGIRAGNGTITLTNTVIAANQGDFALHVNNSASLWNTTVVKNSDGILINADGVADASLIVHNSIVFSNGGSIFNPAGYVTITYSAIQDGWVGEGNISVAPVFEDISSGDYRLQYGSAAIDAGENDQAPISDIENDFRPLDGDLDGNAVVDMGADEYAPAKEYMPGVYNNSP